MAEALERSLKFQSTLSVRRATLAFPRSDVHPKISIHALREESDPSKRDLILAHCRFQSTLSVRRATGRIQRDRGLLVISIHALREESDVVEQHAGGASISISIHALREESDHGDVAFWNGAGIFQSTLSVRRATSRPLTRRSPTRNFNPRSP